MIPALLVDAVAAYRLTKLVTDDTITRGPREAVIREAYLRAGHPPEIVEGDDLTEMAIVDTVEGTAPKIATLVTCRWCAGMWVGAGVIAARRLAPRAWSPVAETLAVAAAAALLAGFED